jgi:lipopolysaccharide transport system permease protein
MFVMSQKENITIYSAETSNHFIINHLRDIMKDLPHAHELGLQLFKRNIKALYRQSFLGAAWAILPPLATSALWIFLRGSHIVSIDDTETSYPVFVLIGTILWQIFSESIFAPLNQVIENKAMLTKINIPREGLLLSGLYQLLFNTGIKIILLIMIFIFFRQTFSLSSLVFVPLGFFVIGLAGFSIGLALTPLGMLYQDINRGLTLLLPFFMYFSPVIYSVPQNSAINSLMKLNPLTIFITQTRNWLIAKPVYDMQYFWLFTFAFALLFIVSLVTYRLSMPMVIERIGS